ncbi:MAG: hypothetical protein M2R45_05362 [Verrucomicrobia subdivision 3 bacterium]|nr:hypothetical protein [Limisphaerales bacterium]MCS1417113.1 hypothetical protein [Limisphaerales bacterium]
MKLKHGLHLAYCANIHRGENWEQIFDTLSRYTLEVRKQICPADPYAIGLRLGNDAARELSRPKVLAAFQNWLDQENCYVFTINGFPYGTFHGRQVKELVYQPDWTIPERLAYTNLLFDLLAALVPDGVEGSVSTVPVCYKEHVQNDRYIREARKNLWKCVDHIEQLSRRTGKKLHLGLEPEPLCYLATSEETVRFFEQMRKDRPGDLRIEDHLGVNYDCCHLAVEFERAREALGRLQQHKIRISKIHLSSALKVHPTPEVREALRAYTNDIYFHQVVERSSEGSLKRYRDLEDALASDPSAVPHLPEEWRIHFHIPLYTQPTKLFDNTADHIAGTLDFVKAHPGLCSHFEMETYTWEVLPPELKRRNVVDQLADEYRWTLKQMAGRGLAQGARLKD